MNTFTISRSFGAETAEVVINNDGSFMIGQNGPPHTIRNEPIDRANYGWNEVSILDMRGQAVMTGHVINGKYTFGQFTDTNKYLAAARALWGM